MKINGSEVLVGAFLWDPIVFVLNIFIQYQYNTIMRIESAIEIVHQKDIVAKTLKQ